MTFVKQPTKVLIEQEMRKARSCEPEGMSGKKTTNESKILKDVHSFYQNVLGTDKVADEAIDAHDFKIRSLQKDSGKWMTTKLIRQTLLLSYTQL
jgi:hypothetical protein